MKFKSEPARATSEALTPVIKVDISGGVCAHVESTGPAIVEVYDYDNLGEQDGEDDCSPAVYRFGDGKTLHDDFMMAALPAVILSDADRLMSSDYFAKAASEIADACMKARKR